MAWNVVAPPRAASVAVSAPIQQTSSSFSAARDVTSEENKARAHAFDFAKGWSDNARLNLAEICGIAVRRGASSDDIKQRLRWRYCLFDECKKSGCQRCAVGKTAASLKPRSH